MTPCAFRESVFCTVYAPGPNRTSAHPLKRNWPEQAAEPAQAVDVSVPSGRFRVDAALSVPHMQTGLARAHFKIEKSLSLGGTCRQVVKTPRAPAIPFGG